MSVIGRMVKNAVRCTKCGAGFGKCDCWIKCHCGWLRGRNEKCNNPKHAAGAAGEKGKDGQG